MERGKERKIWTKVRTERTVYIAIANQEKNKQNISQIKIGRLEPVMTNIKRKITEEIVGKT